MGINSLDILNKGKLNIKQFLNERFKEIYLLEDTQVYLLGGAVKDIIQGFNPKDLDIVLLESNTSILERFILENNFIYTKNSFGGYKIIRKGLNIDIWTTNDLYKNVEYNLDGLFYDISHNLIIPFGFIEGVESHKIFKLNSSQSHPIEERQIERENKLKKYI